MKKVTQAWAILTGKSVTGKNELLTDHIRDTRNAAIKSIAHNNNWDIFKKGYGYSCIKVRIEYEINCLPFYRREL